MNRFFVGPLSGDRFPLPAAIEHQVTRVLRLGDGDRIVLLDGTGDEVVCVLHGGECVVERRGVAGGEPVHRLALWQALLKGDHLEPVVRHATEVGVSAFHLFVSDRCVVRDLSARRLERLRAIAREAAEQCERGTVPEVRAPLRFADALESGATLLYERRSAKRLSELAPPSGLIVGPEGGFSEAEVDEARRRGNAIAGLGPRILRSESVGVAAAAVVLARSGDFA